MGNNYKTIVYLTVNTVNKNIYIGIHDTEDPYKFDGYIGNGINIFRPSSNAHPNCPFHYAVKKYGFDAFIRSTIKICETREEARKIEAFLVDEEFIARKDTYNITLGGGDPPIHEKRVYQYDLEGNYLNEYISILSAEKTVGISSGIGSAVKYKTISGGYLWSFEQVNKLNISDYKIVVQTKPVYAYDKHGNFVKEYKTISDFCRENKVSLHPVQMAIASKTKSRGYYLSTEKVDKFVKEKVVKDQSEVHQYALDGTFIRTWKSCLEASRVLGPGYTQIARKIKIGNPVCGDYQWTRTKVEKMPSAETKEPKKVKVGQFDDKGNLIKIFDSVRECRKEFGNVSRVLSGKVSHCKGYVFKYV